MVKETSIEEGKNLKIASRRNLLVIGVAIFLVIVVLVLWWRYGYHYVWVPLETTWEGI